MIPTKLTRMVIEASFALMFCGTARLTGQAASSLTDREIETSETRTTFEALLRENDELRKKLQHAEMSVGALQRNLAASNAEAEVLKRKIGELMLRFEALGFDSVGDAGRLEQRLLKAVNDLRLADQDREALKKALIELSEAALRFQKTAETNDAEVRLTLEAAVRNASKALGGLPTEAIEASPVAAALSNGIVIAVKEDLALVVTNLGHKHGVKAGMPFRVLRGENEIGTVRVIDVREKFAGALIQDLRSDTKKIQVGDQLKISAER